MRGDDSVTSDPTNLPEAFQKGGLKVEAVARRLADMMGTRQVGRSWSWSASVRVETRRTAG